MSKKTLLYITELFPFPADSGGKIKSLNTIQTLSKKFNITLVCFSEKSVSQSSIKTIKKYVQEVAVFKLKNLDTEPKQNLTLLIRNYLQLKPYLIFQMHSEAAKKYIERFIADNQPSIIHIDHLSMSQYLPNNKQQIWVHEEHNVESQLAYSKFKNFPVLKKTKLFFFLEFILIYLYELKTYHRFDHIFAISDYDSRLIQKMFFISKITTQKLVCNPTKTHSKSKNNNNLLFVGDMTWAPNISAINWFVSTVLPKISVTVEDTKLHLVGKIEAELQKKLTQNKNVVVHGYQEFLDPHLRNNSVFILPFHSGGGVRIKALIAIANKLPLVSTPLGVQGLDLQNNHNVLISNDPNEFAKQCIILYKNKKLRQQLINNATKYLLTEHSKSNNKYFLSDYLRILE